ncbi:protein FMC1 homolog [Agrilus planipennis]|uniref:Protein FMC1 homolog n=1 Tax=Agrilus planipennis TaxID=224129 RepID=A0A1W4WWV8_AGRPL|nr:protein FMC1 homolog [Agrilus planipennis]
MNYSSPAMQTLRRLMSEMRRSSSQKNPKDNLALQYVLNQYRKFNVTDQQTCKAKDEAKFLADTYLCYLQSTRLHNEIRSQYHGKGERTVQETAKIVGFKLPHEPK